jgi:hypothetical protein
MRREGEALSAERNAGFFNPNSEVSVGAMCIL